MEIGTEISQKIRSAIKAKLVELGAYVDDELPDYIMVMVANKKTKKHMSDDLSLFLAQNTDKFTSWLHNLLNKLQTLSTDQQKSNEIENDSKKSSDTKKKSSQKTQSEAKVKNTEKTSSNSRRKSSTDKHDKGTVHKVEERVKVVEKAIPVKSNTSSVKSSELGKDTTKAREEFVPELLVKEETDEFSEEFKEKDVNSAKTSNKPQKATSSVRPTSKSTGSLISSSSAQRTSKAASSREERTVQKVPVKKTIPEKRKMPSSVVGSSQITKRYAEEDEEEYDPYNPAVGRVASVIKVDRRSTIPASLQANRLLVMKAVNEAEKSCAKSSKPMLQQEKMYSEKEKALIKPIQRLEPYTPISGRVKKEEGSLELISKSRRQEMLRNMTYTIDNFTKKTLPERLGQKRQHEPEVARVPPVMDSRFVQCSNEEEEEEDTVQEVEEDVANDNVSHTSEHELDRESGSVHEEVEETNSRSSGDKEVHEVEEDDDAPQEEEEVQEEEQEQDEIIETDPEIQQVLEDVDANDLDLDEQEVFQPATSEPKAYKYVKKPDLKRPRVPSPPKPVNTKFIVTLDGVEPEIFENKEEMLEVEEEIQEEYEEEYEEVLPVKQKYIKEDVIQLPVTKITPPKINTISINLKDTDDEADNDDDDDDEEEGEEEEKEDNGESPLKMAKLMERCKFWPACVNGNSCSYHHPTTSCKTFPHCKFGEKCLYIHPNCKFDSKCTRRDCPFTHASRRGNLTTVIQQIVPVPLQTQAFTPTQPWSSPNLLSSSFPKQGGQMNCKFYPNCRNMSCPFNHPKPCRYGLACMNKTSCTFYHPTVPTKDKLTWTAQKPPPPQQQHISERKFDAGDAKSIPTSVT